MRLPKNDLIATGLVAVAVLVYGLWAIGHTPPGLGTTRSCGIVVLALGFVASASAVVPGFAALMHGNRRYLVVTTILGLLAFVGGLMMLVADSGVGFTLMTAAMTVLWLVSTVHHGMVANRSARRLPIS